MIYRIIKKNKRLKGTIHLPSSKSESNRALIIRALCEKSFEIKNLSEAEDTKILQFQLSKSFKLLESSSISNIGAAGTAMRFLTAFFTIQQGKEIILTGSERMKNRPIKILVDALKYLGADIEYLEKTGFPPLKIKGKNISGGKINVNGSISSQFISALLMIAPTLKKGLTIEFSEEIISMPYIEMTLKIMEHFGIKNSTDFKSVIQIPSQKYKPAKFTVESDWSAASYWYAMAAFSDEVDLTLVGLKKNSLQGDSVVAKIFEQFGVKTKYLKNGIHLKKIQNPKSKIQNPKFKIDCSNFPDLAQTIAVTCAGLSIPAHLKGLKTLRIKETDRISALQNELKKIGIKTKLIRNGEIKICNPERVLNPFGVIHTYDDHRMAMAFAPLAIKYGTVKIENPEVVKKSYPGFWKDLKKTGFEIRKE